MCAPIDVADSRTHAYSANRTGRSASEAGEWRLRVLMHAAIFFR